jgi:hypothetical protein
VSQQNPPVKIRTDSAFGTRREAGNEPSEHASGGAKASGPSGWGGGSSNGRGGASPGMATQPPGGKWRPVRVLTIDTRTRPEGDRRVKLHWAGVGVERLAAGPIRPDTYFSFNLCAVSNADFARILELHQEYYDRVRSIVADSTVADRVLLLNQQLIPLDC